ncbi:aspartyl protease [Cooperia oncophora]
MLHQCFFRRFRKAVTAFPESFTKTPLLYLRCRVNGEEMLALVDTGKRMLFRLHATLNHCVRKLPLITMICSGAQTSIISMNAVKKCDLVDAIDDRFRVMANGVGGTRSSLGRILACDVQIDGMNILCSFDVLASDVQDADVIIGLDVLTKNQAVINISERTIRFGNLGNASFVAAEEAENLKPFAETTK